MSSPHDSLVSDINGSLEQIGIQADRLMREYYELASKDSNPIGSMTGTRTMRAIQKDFIYLASNATRELTTADQAVVIAKLALELRDLVALMDNTTAGSSSIARDLDGILSQIIFSLSYLSQVYMQTNFAPGTHDRVSEYEVRIDKFQSLRLNLNYDETKQRSEKAAERVETLAEISSQAVSSTADDVLGLHYMRLADTESQTADDFRRVAVGLLLIDALVGVGISAWILLDKQGSATAQVFKFLAILPLILAALYLSHESNSHRKVGWRAREFQLRLITLGAFTASLTDEGGQDLRTRVGESIFTGPALLSQDADNPPASIKDVIEVAKELRAPGRRWLVHGAATTSLTHCPSFFKSLAC